jgi:hypothetical protein
VRDRIAVDVRIEDTGLVTQPRKGRGEVRRQRRFAHAALSARNGDDPRLRVDGDSRGALGDAAAKLRRQRGLLIRRHHVEGKRDLPRPERAKRPVHLLLEARPEGAARNRQRDREGDAISVEIHVADHVELDDRATELRVDDTFERPNDLVLEEWHGT